MIHRGRLLTLTTIAATAALLIVSPTSVAQDRVIIKADRGVAADGSLVSNMQIVIENGAITAVSTAGAPVSEATTIIDYGEAVISPGIIEIASGLGVGRDRFDRTHPMDPSLSIVDAFNPNARDLRRAALAGITGAMITPAGNHLIGGTAATVRTWTRDGSAEGCRGSPGHAGSA